MSVASPFSVVGWLGVVVFKVVWQGFRSGLCGAVSRRSGFKLRGSFLLFDPGVGGGCWGMKVGRRWGAWGLGKWEVSRDGMVGLWGVW